VDAERMAKETVAAFGTIDGIVCGAIKLVPGKLEELPEEDWDMVMDIGLKGYFLCAQAAGRVMLEKGSGSIIFLSSVGGVQAYNGAGAYSISKAGAIMLGKLFGVEWGGRPTFHHSMLLPCDFVFGGAGMNFPAGKTRTKGALAPREKKRKNKKQNFFGAPLSG